MKTILLAAGAAAIAFSAGPTLAAAKHGAMAGPKQPIPYAELTAYMKASPKQRATKDWWSGQAVASTGASTGGAANTAATSTAGSDVRSAPDAASAPSNSSTTASPDAAAATSAQPVPATPPVNTPPTGSTVNPSPATPPGAAPSSTPPK